MARHSGPEQRTIAIAALPGAVDKAYIVESLVLEDASSNRDVRQGLLVKALIDLVT